MVIPVYNQRPGYLAEAVASVEEQTERTEVVVVDDGSDEPVPGAHVRHDVNRGISAALNSGIGAMTGEWFCWLSSDDTMAPEKVETQKALTKAAGRLCSFHRYYRVADGETRISIVPNWPNHKRQRQELGQGCLINGSTVMIHRSVFDNVGLFDESYRFGQDWEMWCRIGEKYEWHYLAKPMVTRRADGNLTSRIAADEGLRAIRDAEDARIRQRYGP